MDGEFATYVTERSPALLRTAYLLTGDRGDAEDLLQDALFKLSLAWPRINDPGAVDAYARRILVNLQSSRWRRKRVPTTSVDVLPEPGRMDSGTEGFGDRDEIWRALSTLPAKMRATLVLRFYEDMSEVEIGHALGCSVGTVKSQASRALAKLGESMPERTASWAKRIEFA